jgi:hypothetical protein
MWWHFFDRFTEAQAQATSAEPRYDVKAAAAHARAQMAARKPTPQKAMAHAQRRFVDECLTAARRMPPDTRKLMARHLTLTYLQLDDATTFEKRAIALPSIHAVYQAMKNDAAKIGGTSLDNPQWNMASCIEWITFAEGAAMKTLDVAVDAAAIRDAVQSFIAENTTTDELAEMQALHRTMR